MPEQTDLYSRRPSRIVLYGVDWCPDCRRARAVLAREQIAYLDVNVDRDPQAESFVKELNRGFRSVPTIIFPDGRVLVEPRDDQLSEAVKAAPANG